MDQCALVTLLENGTNVLLKKANLYPTSKGNKLDVKNYDCV